MNLELAELQARLSEAEVSRFIDTEVAMVIPSQSIGGEASVD